MDIRSLKYLLAIADCASVPRAAESLGVSRQAVGKELRSLEEEAGTCLFERRSGTLVPSDACAAMLPEVRDVVRRFDDLVICRFRPVATHGRGALAAQDPGMLDIAMVVGCTRALPERFFGNYLRLNPGCRLNFEEMSSDMVLAGVASGHSDVGLVGSHPELLEGFESCLVTRSGIWLGIDEHDPLALKEQVELADLHGRALVTPGKHNHVHRFVLGRCAQVGVKPDVRGTSADEAISQKMVRENQAICFGFSPSMAPAPAGTVARKLAVAGGDAFGTYAIRKAQVAGQASVGNARSGAGLLFWDMCRAISARV